MASSLVCEQRRWRRFESVSLQHIPIVDHTVSTVKVCWPHWSMCTYRGSINVQCLVHFGQIWNLETGEEVCVYIGNGRLVQFIGITVQGLDLNSKLVGTKSWNGTCICQVSNKPTSQWTQFDIMRIRYPSISQQLILYTTSCVPTCWLQKDIINLHVCNENLILLVSMMNIINYSKNGLFISHDWGKKTDSFLAMSSNNSQEHRCCDCLPRKRDERVEKREIENREPIVE